MSERKMLRKALTSKRAIGGRMQRRVMSGI